MDINNFVKTEAKSLPIFLLLDTSGSMSGEKIASLNSAVLDMINDFKNERLTEVSLLVSIITFGGVANLHTELSPIKNFVFNPLSAGGMTPLGSALKICQTIIDDKEKVSSKGYKPVVILVSDGMPNDEWRTPLDNFINGKRSSKCERWALGIGADADFNMLELFLNDKEKRVFAANEVLEIAKFFKIITMSTIARSKSINPNVSLDFNVLEEKFKEDKPSFKF